MTIKPGKIIEDLIGIQEKVADLIRNGPSDGLPGHVRDQYRKRCDQFANLPGWARALSNGSTGTMNRICQPYWNDGGFDGKTIDRPFTGGQCEGNYTVSVLINGNLLSVGGESPKTIAGPLGGVTRTAEQITGGPFPEFRVIWAFSNDPVNKRVTVQLNQGQLNASSIGVAPQSGNPDDCGNPPGELEPGDNPPPDPGPTPGPEPTTDPDDPFGVPLLPIPPYDDPLGGPTPIEAPDAPVIPGNPDSGPGSPENIGEPIAVEPSGGEGEETPFGDPPDGSSWIGCLLNFNLPSSFGGIPGSAPANRVIARVFGNGSLVFDGGRGIAERQNSAWSYLIR